MVNIIPKINVTTISLLKYDNTLRLKKLEFYLKINIVMFGGDNMSKDQYTFSENLKGEIILAVIIFFPLLFTITGIL